MSACTFQTELWLPRARPEVFSFFAEARNLQTITPPWLNFEVLTPAPIVMRPGALIDYRIRVHGIPLRWRTEITVWDPPGRFVDVQLRGPYTLWHHTHTFEERDGGTLCLDHVRYRPRGGALVNWLFVRRDLERIFRYRQQRLQELLAIGANNDSKGRAQPAAPIDVAVRTEALCHLQLIAAKLQRKLRWDPARQKFLKDAEANALLDRPMRAPWKL